MIILVCIFMLMVAFALLKYQPPIKTDEELMFRFIELQRLRRKNGKALR